MSKYIITKAYNQGDWFNKDVALISITDKFKEKVKEIRDFLISAPVWLKESVEITQYNFGFVYFFDTTLIDDTEDEEFSADILTIEAWLANGGGKDSVLEINDLLNLHYIIGEVDAHYTKCIISSSGVSFHAQNKYGNEEEMWTDPIPFDLILNF